MTLNLVFMVPNLNPDTEGVPWWMQTLLQSFFVNNKALTQNFQQVTAASAFAVNATDPPSMSVQVNGGVLKVGGLPVIVPSFTLPITGSGAVGVYLNGATGAASLLNGNVSAVDWRAMPTDNFAVASINIAPGATAIYAKDITDLRAMSWA